MVDLEVRHTEQYGRGLYTRGKISCGMEVLREEPFVHVLTCVLQGTRCDWCLVESRDNLSRCARCKRTWYCGINCQRNDWLQHKAECKGIAAIQPHVPTDTMRLVVRALQKNRGKNMESLCSVKDSVGVIAKEQVAEQLLGVKALLREDFDGGHAYDVLCKLICNTFSICDGEMVAIGAGVYIQCSQLNHSCDPNCVALFAGKTLTVRAIKDIPAGDQMHISYVDLVDSCWDRRSQLKKVYGFVCVCVRCLVEEREDKETAEVMKELEYRKSLKATRDWKGIVGCHQLTPHCTVVTAIRESELMCEAQLELGMWKHAANTASTLVDLYRRWLFQYHPLIGLTLMKLGKLQRVEGTVQQLKASITPLTQAVHCLGVSHGPTHPLTREALEMLMDSDSELMNRSSVPLADNH